MCGRYTLSTPGDRLGEVFGVDESVVLEPRFNIAPTQPAPVVVIGGEGPGRTLEMLRWGLVPYWADDVAIGSRMINARAETVERKPAYRDSFAKRRCLVPADGFYEWKKVGRHKQPYYFSRADGEPFAIAGIWSSWNQAAPPLYSFALLTTAANETVAPIHDRMPWILEPEDWTGWLGVGGREAVALREGLQPTASDLLTAYPVSTYVNSPTNDSSRCIEALADGPAEAGAELPSGNPQKSLF